MENRPHLESVWFVRLMVKHGGDASQTRGVCTDGICRTTYPRMLDAGAALSGLKTLNTTATTKMGEMTTKATRYTGVYTYTRYGVMGHVSTADSRLVVDAQNDISKPGAQQRVIVLCQCENI